MVRRPDELAPPWLIAQALHADRWTRLVFQKGATAHGSRGSFLTRQGLVQCQLWGSNPCGVTSSGS